MDDFRLKVFYTVAKRLSFTKAAAELFITQPAVTKHIRELEGAFNITLFERSGNKKIMLTPAGELMLQYATQLLHLYSELEYNMHQLTQQHKGVLNIGASTTVAQYVLPPVLAAFKARFAHVNINLTTANTDQVEQALLHHDIDLGIVEGLSNNPQLHYDTFLNDELVLVSRTGNSLVKKDTIKPAELLQLPMLLREHGSGTLDVLAHALKPHHIKLADLQVQMHLGSTESIKAYLLNSNCVAFLSVRSVLRELNSNQCRVIDVKGLSIERPFYFIQPHGQASALVHTFMRFTLDNAT